MRRLCGSVAVSAPWLFAMLLRLFFGRQHQFEGDQANDRATPAPQKEVHQVGFACYVIGQVGEGRANTWSLIHEISAMGLVYPGVQPNSRRARSPLMR